MGSFAGYVAKDMDKGMQYSKMAWCKDRKTMSKLSRYLARYENTGSSAAGSTDSCKPTLGSRTLILNIRMGFDANFWLNVSQPFKKAPMSSLEDSPRTWMEKRKISATDLNTVTINGW